MNKKERKKAGLFKGRGWRCYLEEAASEDGALVDCWQLVVVAIAGLTTLPMPVHAMALPVMTVDRHFFPAMVAEAKHHSLKVLDNPSGEDAIARRHAVRVQLVSHVLPPSHWARALQRAHKVVPEAVAEAASSYQDHMESCTDAWDDSKAFLGPELVTAVAHRHAGVALERGVREGCNVEHVKALFAASLAIKDARESFQH